MKDPNAPKKPLNGYTVFCKDTREKIKNETGKKAGPELVAIIATKWRNLSKDEKSIYKESYKVNQSFYFSVQ